MSEEQHKPLLSVVIPTLGRPVLATTIDSLAGTVLAKNIEVIVAGKIRDPELLSKITELGNAFAGFKHLDISFKQGDSSNKKNAGLHESLGEIVAFTDDDVKVGADWPSQILAPFEDKAVGMVSGPSLIPDDLPLMARLSGLALASGAAGYVAGRYRKGNKKPREIKWSGIIGCNMAFRKEIISSFDGFDTSFWPGEEMVAAFKTAATHKIVFQPGAALWHYPRATLFGFIKQIYGYGATRIRLLRTGLEFEFTTIIPALMILSFLVLLCLSVLSKTAAATLVALLLIYLAAAVAITLECFSRSRRFSDLLVVLLIPIMHVSYGIGEWIEIFFKNKDLSIKKHKSTGSH
ncbi:MAG: glycosyltransferase [Lentisphaerae bacterium]|nr:glycosyltransferase [Lentisphaerota bacterium]